MRIPFFICGVASVLYRRGYEVGDVAVLPSLETIRDSSWYASAVACTDDYVRNWTCSMCEKVPDTRHIRSFANNVQNTRAYVAVNEKKRKIIVSFRGSKNIQNAIADGIAFLGSFAPIKIKEVKVHVGFRTAAESVFDGVLNTVKLLLLVPKYSNYKISLTGHSLGGAMAVLSTIKLKDALGFPRERFEVVTFGQPPTGNHEFAMWYNEQRISTARVVNRFDIVPHLGNRYPALLTHHLQEVWLTGPANKTKIKICDFRFMFDPECSFSVYTVQFTFKDHLKYLDAGFGDEKCAPTALQIKIKSP